RHRDRRGGRHGDGRALRPGDVDGGGARVHRVPRLRRRQAVPGGRDRSPRPRRLRRRRRRPSRGRVCRAPHASRSGGSVIKRAAVLSTGDELTTGRIADTNAQWIADKLFELGIDVVTVLTVGDYPERIEWAWRQAMSQADIVLSTGGIGPTA